MKTWPTRVANSPKLLLTVIISNWFVTSMLYSIIEHKGPISGLWWGIVTGSTVGYGDFYPKSTAGRGVGAWLIITSIMAVAIGTAQLSSKLIIDHNAFTDEEQKEAKLEADYTLEVLVNLSETCGIPVRPEVHEYINNKEQENANG